MSLGVIAGLVAFAFTRGIAPRKSGRAAPRSATEFETSAADYDLRGASGQLTARSRDGLVARDIDLAIVVDGAVTPLSFARDDMRLSDGVLRARVRVVQGEEPLAATLVMGVDKTNGAISLALEGGEDASLGDHAIALRAEIPSEGQVVFVPGLGLIADRATVTSASLVVGTEPHPIGLASSTGPLTVDVALDDLNAQGEPRRVSVTTTAGRTATKTRLCELDVVLAASSMTVWRSLAGILGQPTATVSGRVTGTSALATVVGLDGLGTLQVRAAVSREGTFSLEVPESVVRWYAAIDPGARELHRVVHSGFARRIGARHWPGGDFWTFPSSTPTRAHPSQLDCSSAAWMGPSIRASAQTIAHRVRVRSSMRFVATCSRLCRPVAIGLRPPRASNGASTQRSWTSRQGG